jgi:hypothetical protein
MNRLHPRAFPSPLFLSLAVLVALALPLEARAALGDDASVIANDQVRLRATLRITPMKGYSIHELELPMGCTVREYVGSSAKVFAVSWSGRRHPDLRDIMGDRYDQYITGTRGTRRARGPVRVELPGMVVVMGGYLRSFWGHAYLTDLAPPEWQAGQTGKTR